MKTQLNKHTRPLAVVTGASTGIGLELARQFAQNNFDLIIAAAGDGIFTAATELQEFPIDVVSVQTDLAQFDGVEKLVQIIKQQKRPLAAVAINAGVGVGGAFHETSLKQEINLINLNVVSTVHLTKRVLNLMYKNGGGKILFTSSIAAILPAPFEAVYGASKAFISSFAEAIRNEGKDHGVSVTILMPGPTETNFFHRAGMDDTRVGSKDKYENDPAEVARQGFEALMAGREKVVAASFKTKLQGFASKFLPDRLKTEFHRKLSEPGTAVH